MLQEGCLLPNNSMPPRKRQRVLDLDHPRLSQSTWATTQFETDSVDGTEHEYTAYDHVPHQDSGIRFATNAPTVVPDRTTPMVLDHEYTEDEQIAVSAASKTKVSKLIHARLPKLDKENCNRANETIWRNLSRVPAL